MLEDASDGEMISVKHRSALMVMGVDGLSIIEKLEGIDALIVERVSEKEFKSVSSSGWNSG